jgi:hypothetical protein
MGEMTLEPFSAPTPSLQELSKRRQIVRTRNATLEALRCQNGLEASYTRGVFHALGRFGVKEATLFEDIALLLRRGPRAAEEERRRPSCDERRARRNVIRAQACSVASRVTETAQSNLAPQTAPAASLSNAVLISACEASLSQ